MYSSLPSYPCVSDVWDRLKGETRPIIVYGMGNGADKLFLRFSEYGIKVSEVMASDGFVRGHSYRGFLVKPLSEIVAAYPDFVIVLSFASNREEVIRMLCELDRKYELVIPDMPVTGNAYFDRAFYNLHYPKIKEAYDALADEESRQIFSDMLHYKLTGKLSYLLAHVTSRDALYDTLPTDRIQCVLDAGAYTGDTVKEAIAYFPHLRLVIAVEPDPKTFKRLLRTVAALDGVSVQPCHVAVGASEGYATFHSSGNRNSSLSGASFEHRDGDVEVQTVDSLLSDTHVDFIKYDVEGAEAEALTGSHTVIVRDRPSLLVSLYHRSEDIFSLILTVKSRYPFYRLLLRRLRAVPAWELDLLALTDD